MNRNIRIYDEFKQYCKYWGLHYDFADDAMYLAIKKANYTKEEEEAESKCLQREQK